jgi:hypothetical protein
MQQPDARRCAQVHDVRFRYAETARAFRFAHARAFRFAHARAFRFAHARAFRFAHARAFRFAHAGGATCGSVAPERCPEETADNGHNPSQ